MKPASEPDLRPTTPARFGPIIPVAPWVTEWHTPHSLAKTWAPRPWSGLQSAASAVCATVNESKPKRGRRKELNMGKRP
ncbi:hypothetical protein D3C73_1404040 [compost metagenome]